MTDTRHGRRATGHGTRHLKRGTLLLSSLVSLVSSLAIGCQQAAPDTGPKVVPAVPVTVGAAAPMAVRRSIPVTGTLNGYEDITLSPKVDGQVVATKFDVGDVVKPGDVLLELDPVDYQLSVRLAERDVAVQEAQVKVAKAQMKAAEAPLAEAERAVDRLTKANAAAGELDTAKSKVAVTLANIEVAKSGVAAAETTLDQKMRSLDIAKQRLADSSLRVPQSPQKDARYVVAAKMVSVGEMARSFPGTNAYRLVMWSVLKLRVTVPEKHDDEVKMTQSVDVRVEKFPGEVFRGTVVRRNETIDPQTRTFLVEVEVPNPDGRLKAGGFARGDIVTGTAQAVVVPPTAVVVFAGVSKVFVADGDKAREVRVEVGDRGPDWVEVRGDLKPGQQVITSGFVQVYDGAPISIRK